MKRPSFQFYPADWRNNAKLRRCSEGARGAWIDVLCLMHDSDEYGVLRWPMADIARAAGVPLKLLKELVDRDVLKGGDKGCDAYIHTPTHARKQGDPITLLEKSHKECWYSSRFLVDEWKRSVSGANTRFKSPDTSPSHGEVNGKVIENESPDTSPSARRGDGATSSSTSKNLKPTSQPVNAREDGKFSMCVGWEPSDYLPTLAKQAGVIIPDTKLGEFITHWLTRPTVRTQAEWDKALIQSALHDKMHLASPLPPRVKPAPENFTEKNYGTGVTAL